MSFEHPPPGQRETFVDARSGLTLEAIDFYFSFLDDTTKAVVESLRAFFRTNPRVAKAGYRWQGIVRENGEIESAPSPVSKIHISTEHPDQAKRWPSILVREVTGNIRDLWLGKKMGTLYAPNPNYSEFDEKQSRISGDNYDEQPVIEVGERYGGIFEMRVTLAISAVGTGARTECNRVSDLVTHGLVMPVVRELARRGFDWMPDGGSVAGETMSSLQGMERDKEGVRTLTFGLQTEWYDDFFFVSEIIELVDLKRVYLEGIDPKP